MQSQEKKLFEQKADEIYILKVIFKIKPVVFGIGRLSLASVIICSQSLQGFFHYDIIDSS